MKKILILLLVVFSSVCSAQQFTEQEKLKQIEAQQQLLKDGKISYDDYLKNVEAIRAEKSAAPTTSKEAEQSKKIIEETNENARKKAEENSKQPVGNKNAGTQKSTEKNTSGELTKEQAEAQIKEATRKQEEEDAKARQIEDEKKKAEERAVLQKQEEEKAKQNSIIQNNNTRELNQANRIRPGDELMKFSKQFYSGLGLFVVGEGVSTLGLIIASAVIQSTGGASIGVVGPLFMLGGAILGGVGAVNLTTSFLHIRNAGKLMNQKQDILSK